MDTMKHYRFYSRKKGDTYVVMATTILEAREMARKMFPDARFENIVRW